WPGAMRKLTPSMAVTMRPSASAYSFLRRSASNMISALAAGAREPGQRRDEAAQDEHQHDRDGGRLPRLALIPEAVKDRRQHFVLARDQHHGDREFAQRMDDEPDQERQDRGSQQRHDDAAEIREERGARNRGRLLELAMHL